ncbi:MAG: 5'-nucleotidase C-terminal domain-containing protein [Deltaproteobacteria bacterium]|nr:5'-nucleotidase C-terminal domain-containing protein [Deltaproteobacteria bacterium]
MKFIKSLLVVAFLMCVLLFPFKVFATNYQLTILHTNDHHGHFMKYNPYPVKDVGGLAAQSTLVNIVRAEVQKEGGFVMLLSGGDLNTGIPESDLLDAEPDIVAMNMIGYDAMVLGNHEFDNSPDVLIKQKKWAEFPFISANIFKKDTGEALVKPYVIKEYDGLKVAILGLTTEKTPILTLPANVKDLVFKNPIEIAKSLVPRLKKEADLVIVLSHLGLYEGMDTKGDLALAKAVPEIDVIVGGHTHTELTEALLVGNTIIVQAGGYSDNVGRLDLSVDKETNKISQHRYELVPVNKKKRVKFNKKRYYMYVDKGYVEDTEIVKAMEPYLAKADSKLSQPIGQAGVALMGGKTESRSKETNLGNLITDAMRDKTSSDIAFQNGGGIRASISPGAITYRDILTVQPFGNTLVIVDMTGAQIMDALNFAATKVGSGAFLHVSGLKWTIMGEKAKNVMVADQPIELGKTYQVVTNNFMATGGDGYAMLKPLPQEDTGFVDADAFKDYVTKLDRVEPKLEGRLTITP